jgi:outer membrane protein TolC
LGGGILIVLDDFDKLKAKVERLKAEKERAEGARDQLLRTLKEEFGCKSLQEAEALLAKLQSEETAALKKYNSYRTRFEKRWRKVLRKVK